MIIKISLNKQEKIVINKKYLVITCLIALFLLAFINRLMYLLVNGYPMAFIDYSSRTINMINTLENWPLLFNPEFASNPEWTKMNTDWHSNYWWFQIEPPLTYFIGDLIISPFVKDVNVGWVSCALFFSIGIFTIYYLIKHFLNNDKIALIACLLYALCPADSYSISKGVFIHSLAISIYPLLIIFTDKLIKNFNKKNFALMTFSSWAIINTYTVYLGIYLISLTIYCLLNKTKLKNIRIVMLSIGLSMLLSINYLIRFFKVSLINNLGFSLTPLIALFNINSLLFYFPHDSFGVITYSLISPPIKLLALTFVILLFYKLLKKKDAVKDYKILPFFAGPFIFYLLQFVGLASYPRRILFQSPQLISIAGAIGLIWLISITRLKMVLKDLITITIIIAIIWFDFNNALPFINTNPLHMNDNRYAVIEWLRSNTPSNETIYFLNPYEYSGFSVWGNFAYRKTVSANSSYFYALITNGTDYSELLNYNYLVINDFSLVQGTFRLIDYLKPLLFSNNYTLSLIKGEVGVFSKV